MAAATFNFFAVTMCKSGLLCLNFHRFVSEIGMTGVNTRKCAGRFDEKCTHRTPPFLMFYYGRLLVSKFDGCI